MREACDVNCEGFWRNWGGCDKNGKQTRVYEVLTDPKNNGTACPSPQTKTCSDDFQTVAEPNVQNSKTKLLQECEGKCTQNSDCAENLVCYNGEFGDYIPGCKGTTNHTKYCVKGTHLEEEPTSAGTSEASTGTSEASAGASAAGTVANVVACQVNGKATATPNLENKRTFSP